MAGKNREGVGLEIIIPLDSDLPARLQKVSEATGLSDRELLEKWLTQEEGNLHALQHYVESQLRLKNDSSAPLSGMPRRVQEPPQEQPRSQGESEESITESDSEQGYRQALLQRIHDMREEGMTYSKIAAQFNEEGVVTVSGTGKWYPSSISQLLGATR
jgi:hypothetical protein